MYVILMIPTVGHYNEPLRLQWVLIHGLPPLSLSFLSQVNQEKLFKEIVQFSPGKLQSGGGSGLGLYSKLIYVFSWLTFLVW